ncbi:transcriptional repressor LexA [Corynebacterium uterequi]|uniref:LexA repressor n=1 Tax=Corynebacterium uterequi TaxID=1072256 RepID=A0A0G3HEY2_9CORY|nr:transcriptional repressor LexA [Corynebacterium uterequi]AKK11285.1 SOS regulatory protein LexA [Corynebacterium uterequi]
MSPAPRNSRRKPDPATLTARQRRILEVIRDAVLLRGYAPTIREIGDAVGLKSTSSVAYQLSTLEERGFLRRDPNKPRAVDIRHLHNTDAPDPVSRHADESVPDDASTPSYIPVIGRIAAGNPILAEQNVEGHLPLPSELVGDGDLYMLRVVGESMKNGGILDGDWVVVRSQPVAEEGEYVAAMIDGEATVKELHRDRSGTWLLPKNEAFDAIPGDDAEILGKVVAVFRRL